MNKAGYLAELSLFIHERPTPTFSEWTSLIGKPTTHTHISKNGIEYQVEINVYWDDEDGGDLRIIYSIDNGRSWRTFIPVTKSEILKANDRLSSQEG